MLLSFSFLFFLFFAPFPPFIFRIPVPLFLKRPGSIRAQFLTFPHQTKKTLVPSRINAIINRLEKTRIIRPADELPAAKDAYVKEQRREKRKEAEKLKKEEERILSERRMEKEEKERAWEELQRGEGGRNNEDGFDEDDFM